MTTRTDYHMLKDLHDQFKPANMGVITGTETQTVMSMLEIQGRTDIELQNLRDMAVMLYGQWADQAKSAVGLPAMMKEMDAMSAVTGVIDNEKAKRGMPV